MPMKTKRTSTAVQRWGKCALTLLLACAMLAGLALSAAARDSYQGEVVDPAIPKPVVTVQGNLVVDKPGGKPTGFYELALCVRSGRTITTLDTTVTGNVGDVIDEAAFEAYLAANPTVADDPAALAAVFDIHYYPFTSVGGAVNINTDVLTAVNWAIQNVTYDEYDAVQGLYKDEAAAAIPAPGSYPRGIDTDPDVQGYDPAVVSRADAFPNITTANVLLMDSNPSVAIDVEADPRMFEATGQVDYYDAANSTALMTLTASAPDNRPITLAESTPLVVARFSYDLKRFSTVKVNDVDWAGDVRNAATGDSGDVGLWLGWDKTTAITAGTNATLAQKTPLTWLGESDTVALYDFSQSDFMAARTRVNQTAWVHMVDDDGAVTARDTYFYYYLGSEDNQNDGQETLQVVVGGAPTAVPGITIPKTSGEKVLTEGTQENPVPAPAPSPAPTQAGYTYFRNLLRLKDQTMVLELVNAETFKKPSGGGGGNMILFYDWDDRLIGSLAVDKGDVRAEVEAYIEENLVHPDLRPDSAFMKNAAGTGTDLSKVVSLQRDYTYRGKYAYTVGGNDAALGVTDGKEYPLTNKLDYVFTKRVNTTLTQVDAATGDTVRYVHPYSLDDAVNLDPTVTDAALYPYVYGWAVVEDATAANGMVGATGTKGDWKTMHDADKIEDVWTTAGVGELSNMGRGTMTSTTLSTVGTVDPAAVRTAPAFLTTADPTWTDGTRADANDYLYTLSGQNEYLRFADFSDITAELAKYGGKDTLIVKAVYEEGVSLMDGYNYTAITEPAYTKWNNVAANAGGSYRAQMTVERSYVQNGQLRGTTRIRMPVVQQDTTIDYKWASDPVKGVNHDLENTPYDTSLTKEETLYTQVDTDNGEEITFSLALSARQNKVDYVLIERYGLNFVVGTQRSSTNSDQKGIFRMYIPDNYNYLSDVDSDTLDDLYDPDFSTKEGSHGFVLYGTLGHFLEQATKCNNGEITRTAYNSSVTYTTAIDANLRMNLGGTQPEFLNNTVLRDAYIAAATACAAHKGDPAYDCWDPNLDCAKLTYHQAQWFLLDYQSNPAADILTVAAAEDAGHKLPFCHYHVSCSGGHVPAAPTSWKDLIDKVQEYNNATPGSDDQKNADADLGALELAALDSMTNLRANATGGKFTDLNTFLSALKKADVDLRTAGVSVNWPNLQYAILHASAGGTDALMRAEAEEGYWWYAGATAAPSVTTFQNLLDAAESTYTPVTLKDGDNTFLPKSALKAAAFPDGAKAYLTEANPTRVQKNAWNTLTENLIPSPTSHGHRRTLIDPDGTPNSGDESYEYTYDKYADFDAFLSDFETAYDTLRSPTPPADKDAWWEAIQTALQPPGDDLGDYDGDGSTKFWWRNGNTPFRVMNLSTLVECARRLNAADTTTEEYKTAKAEWDRLKVADIESAAISQGLKWKGTDAAHPMYPYSGADLGGDETTQKFLILTQLRQAVAAFDAAAAADPMIVLTWDNIQYILLNPGVTPTFDTVRAQKTYYWWKDGGTTGTTVTLTPNAIWNTLDANVRTLIQATYRAAFNDPGVTKSLADAAAAAGDSFWDYTRLAKSFTPGTKFPGVGNGNDNDPYDGPDELTDFTGYADSEQTALLDLLADFRDAAKAAQGLSTASDNYDMPSINWQQVQYYLLNGNTYLAAGDPIIKDLRDQDKAQYGDYWWYYLDERVEPDPPKPDVPDPPPNPAAGFLTDFQDVIDGNVTPDDFAANLTPDVLAGWGIVNLDGSPMDDDGVAALQDCIVNMDLVAELDGYGVTLADLTWPRIQVLLSVCARDWYWYITMDDAEALDYLVNGEGAMLVADGGYIPDEYGQIYPEIFGLAFSLRPAELSDLDVPLTQAPAEDPAAIQARIEELERELAQLRQRLAAAQAAEAAGSLPQSAAPTAPSSEGALGNTSQARPSPGGSLKDPEPEDAPTPDEPSSEDVGADVPVGPPDTDASTPENTPHAEREETPQGEDARAVVTVSKARSAVGAAVPSGPQDTNTSGREDVGAAVPSGPQDTNTSDSEHVGTVLPDGPRPTTSVLSAADGEAARGLVTAGSLPQSAAPTAPSSEGALGNTSQARPSPESPSDEGGAPEGGGGREPQAGRAPSLDSPPGLSSGRLSTRRACSATPAGPGVAALHRLTALTPADWRRVRWLM